MTFIPNTTPTPNWLYNGEMKKMSDTELRVVMLITRKTLGYAVGKNGLRKEQDFISQNQFMEFTGKSNRAISTAIQSSIERGWIIARDKDGNLCNTAEKRQRRRVYYQLGNIFTNKLPRQESGQDYKSSENSSQDNNLVNLKTESSELNDTNLVKKVHNTKEIYTKEINIAVFQEKTAVSPYFKEVINYFYEKTKSIHNFKPKIDTADGKILKTALRKYPISKVKEIIYFYLNSDKGKKVGITLKACFSTHSLNEYEKNNQQTRGLWTS